MRPSTLLEKVRDERKRVLYRIRAKNILHLYTYAYIIVSLNTDGQKLAIRLSQRINVVIKSLKKSMAEYNTGLDSLSCLTWEQVTDLPSKSMMDACFQKLQSHL